MAATFSADLSDQISRTRFLLGDMNTASPEVQDETIQYFLSRGLTELGAAAQCAQAIKAKYASYADVNVDDQLTKFSHVYQHWAELADDLGRRAAVEAAAPAPGTGGSSSGGIIVMGIGDCRGPISNDCYPYGGRWC